MRKRPAVKHEHQEQVSFVQHVRAFYPDIVIFAIPNGGNRSAREGKRLKNEGVLAGVSDLFVPEPRGPYHGLFIEMKRTKGGSTSSNQDDFLDDMAMRGYCTAVCRGAQEARAAFEAYLALG